MAAFHLAASSLLCTHLSFPKVQSHSLGVMITLLEDALAISEKEVHAYTSKLIKKHTINSIIKTRG